MLAARLVGYRHDNRLLGQEPKLVGKAVKDAPAHAYAGASVLVASR